MATALEFSPWALYPSPLPHLLRCREHVQPVNGAGQLRALHDAVYANEGLVSRLGLWKVMKGHSGCVNTINWGEDGRYLISGSDDTNLCIWDYQQGGKLCGKISTGHMANIFCAKFFPGMANTRAACCAGDAEIRVFDIERGRGRQPDMFSSSTLKHSSSVDPPPSYGPSAPGDLITPLNTFRCHRSRVKKLAMDPLRREVFLSASEDGSVRQFDLRQRHRCNIDEPQRSHAYYVLQHRLPRTDTCTDTMLVNTNVGSERVELYCVTMNERNPVFFATAGNDAYVRVYDRRMIDDRYTPYKKISWHPRGPDMGGGMPMLDHITGLQYSKDGRKLLASYSGTRIFLLKADDDEEDHMMELRTDGDEHGASDTGTSPTGSKRETDSTSVTDVAEKPSKDDLKRMKRAALEVRKERTEQDTDDDDDDDDDERDDDGARDSRHEYIDDDEDDDDDGDDEDEDEDEDIFGESCLQVYQGHVNLRTVKSVNFFGPNDEYVVSGSDCGNIYLWETETARRIHAFHGDMMVVNCIVGHPYECVLASSGIENHVKLWHPKAVVSDDEEDSDVSDDGGMPGSHPLLSYRRLRDAVLSMMADL